MGYAKQFSPDHVMRRILWVELQPVTEAETGKQDSAERALSLSLLFSGVRCILQYAVLPFVLPLLGVAADAAIPLVMGLTLMALVSIFFSLRRFWQIDYAYRWQYLVVAVTAIGLLTAFTLLDLHTLLGN